MSEEEWFEKTGWEIVDGYGSMAWEPRKQRRRNQKAKYCSGRSKQKTKSLSGKQYTLTIEEAAQLFRIGENKLRSIINEDPRRSFILWNGNKAQIKRKLFELYSDGLTLFK